MKRLIEKILGRFKYVRELKHRADRDALILDDTLKCLEKERRELKAAAEHCSNKQDRIVFLERENGQLQVEIRYLVQMQTAFEEHLEYASDQIKKLADELLAARQIPAKPLPATEIHATGKAPLKAWRCPCGISHPFYEVSCSTCSYTRSTISPPSPPSV